MSTTEETVKLSRETLLELQLLNQKAHRIVAQLEALAQRRSAVTLELNIIPEKEKELQTQKDTVLNELRAAYSAAKEKAGIPEGKELDIETGEAVDSSQNNQK